MINPTDPDNPVHGWDGKTRDALELMMVCADNLNGRPEPDGRIVRNALMAALIAQWMMSEWLYMTTGQDPTTLLDMSAGEGMKKFKAQRKDPNLDLLDDLGVRGYTVDPDK